MDSAFQLPAMELITSHPTTVKGLDVTQFVIPRSMRWPYQSVIGDVLQFVACNTGWRELRRAPTPAGDDRWACFPIGGGDGWVRQLLFWFHDGVPDGLHWVNPCGVPDPLRWRWRPEYRHIRYCPRCMAVGYHSVLHQYPWLTQCFIHPDQHIETEFFEKKKASACASVWMRIFRASGSKCLKETAGRGAFPACGEAMARRYQEFVTASRQVRWITGRPKFEARTTRIVGRDGGNLWGDEILEEFLPHLTPLTRAIAEEAGHADIATSLMMSAARHSTTFFVLQPGKHAEELEVDVVAPLIDIAPDERAYQVAECEKLDSEVVEILSQSDTCRNAQRVMTHPFEEHSGRCLVCGWLREWRLLTHYFRYREEIPTTATYTPSYVRNFRFDVPRSLKQPLRELLSQSFRRDAINHLACVLDLRPLSERYRGGQMPAVPGRLLSVKQGVSALRSWNDQSLETVLHRFLVAADARRSRCDHDRHEN